jgi:hypothetical protein
MGQTGIAFSKYGRRKYSKYLNILLPQQSIIHMYIFKIETTMFSTLRLNCNCTYSKSVF